MSKRKRPLSDSKRYADFIRQRDLALEGILNKYLNACDAVLYALKERTKAMLTPMFIHGIPARGLQDRMLRVEQIFLVAGMELYRQALDLRTSSYALSHMGAVSAQARALGKQQTHDLSFEAIKRQMERPAPAGGALSGRIELYLSRLLHRVKDAIKLGQLLEEKPNEILERVDRAFPPGVPTPKRPPNTLKEAVFAEGVRKLKPVEAPDEQWDYPLDAEGNYELTTGVASQEVLDQMTADYLADELPADLYKRGPADLVNFYQIEPDGSVTFTERYKWELENELTEDFVRQVRDGDNAAAKENGVTDMMWKAILDSHTDECCSWRDGLLSSEIEAQLDGKHSDDDCDATAAPAHIGCRCVSIPASDDLPDEEPPPFEDFHEWLTEQGNL